MAQVRFRSIVTPLHRGHALPRHQRLGALAHGLPSVAQAVAHHRPSEPMHCLRPRVLTETARRFVASFAADDIGGDVLYAVKCNPEPSVLRALWAGGVRHFDVASPGEIRLMRSLFPKAELHYMHPVKARPAIRAAYFQYAVRDFALDSLEELSKIREETGEADDLGLMVRLAVPKGGALYDLSGKFGASPTKAMAILKAARTVAPRVGLCFHVGSQCMDPGAYERALKLAGCVIEGAGVAVDVLDVGGGFPVSYPDVTPLPLKDFMAAVARGLAVLDLPAGVKVWCEPGRALVAQGVSLVVQVIKRRGRELFINDGVYGSLSDAGAPAFRFPARLVRPQGSCDAPLQPFSFFGPTCDSADFMAGPFLLPADIQEGDWIELGQLGAYGACLRTAFNGFDETRLVEVSDMPLLDTPGYNFREARAA
ncbi:MAG TPA: type III PLP-dependent enzyme [Azospirillaceae bacterium]|nr:type III PLP-dependent enzyme [Azospirillaceae bacterium]